MHPVDILEVKYCAVERFFYILCEIVYRVYTNQIFFIYNILFLFYNVLFHCCVCYLLANFCSEKYNLPILLLLLKKICLFFLLKQQYYFAGEVF